MTSFEQRNVGELVAQDYRTAAVFKKYNIDFCCGGGVSIAEACKKKNVNQEHLLADLHLVSAELKQTENYSHWELDKLADYIVETHHEYVKSKLPEIQYYSFKVARVHGEHHPETIKIAQLVEELHNEMLTHMNKEEMVLFPFVKILSQVEKQNGSFGKESKPHFGSVQHPIYKMEEEHEHAADLLAQIKTLSAQFTPPEDACTTYRVLYQNLKAFQDDLFKHVHLENNILFPKALVLEEKWVA